MKLQNLISSVLVLPLTGWAGVLVTENFDYADGDLTGNPAWTAHSGGGEVLSKSPVLRLSCLMEVAVVRISIPLSLPSAPAP
ncbi:MAG: hypothetical protein ACJAQT_003127 [Akkermansiaceae bacterium]|jgi:hypothetical protein